MHMRITVSVGQKW